MSHFLKPLQIGGTQSKWYDKANDTFLKADDEKYFGGCEGLAETVCSDLLKKSTFQRTAEYTPERFRAGFHTYVGCRSRNFLAPGEHLITAADIVRKCSLNLEELSHSHSVKELIELFIQTVRNAADGFDITNHLCRLLEFDELVLNPDRNLGNIDFVATGDSYEPIVFDNGRSFATNQIKKYPTRSPEGLAENVSSLPFANHFSLQVEAIRSIAGRSLFRTSYSIDDLDKSLTKCRGIYPEDVMSCVRAVFIHQMLQHPEYFLSPDREMACQNYLDAIQDHCPDFSSEKAKDENSNDLGDLVFFWKKDSSIWYFLSVPAKKLVSLSEDKEYPLTPPEQIQGKDRDEIQEFLNTIRDCMTKEREQEL